jgi:hypothetical protein
MVRLNGFRLAGHATETHARAKPAFLSSYHWRSCVPTQRHPPSFSLSRLGGSVMLTIITSKFSSPLVPLPFVLFASLIAFPATVHALAFETFGNAAVGKNTDWADGVVDLVNLKTRVYSHWVNGNDNFFFRGTDRDVNEALGKFAAVKADLRQLVLLPSVGRTHSFDQKPIEFDWQVHVPSGIYKAVVKRNHAVMTIHVTAKKPRKLKEGERKQIGKWLGDLDSNVFSARDAARLELEKVGNDAKPMLRDAIKKKHVLETQRRIEELLGRLRPMDVTDLSIPKGITIVTVDELLEQALKGVNDKDSTVSGIAVHELGRLTPFSDRVLPALIEMLKEGRSEYPRRVAAVSLGEMGVKARAALPMLKLGLADKDVNVQKAFQVAIDRIENAKAETVDVEREDRQRAILAEIRELKRAVAKR